MKRIALTVSIAAICAAMASCGAKSPRLASNSDTLNWAIGMQTAQGLKGLGQMGLTVDNDIIIKAIQATLEGKASPLNDTQYYAALEQLNMLISLGQKQAQQRAVEEATAGEDDYFARLQKENPNVKKSKDGFYYEVLQAGHGPVCKYRQVVVFDYRSFTIDGKEYDKTYGNRDPITHVVGEPMFQGLIQGLCLMNAGSKFRFYFPHETCMGANPDNPYTPMIYEIELHEVRNE
ncbi:MAG: FKBP-type peptidyl-prolyl cis-trans isomerase [Bacteroidales bacterium]|nr:FKBP-type peptidyl-prolyl cis-trans isomerase [Bacteroidales bacterium]